MIFCAIVFLSGILDAHVAEIGLLTKRIAAQEDVAEQFKVNDQMAWIGALNSIRARVEIFALNITGGKPTPATLHRLTFLFKTACEK